MWHSIKSWCMHSATIGVARTLYAVGFAIEIAAQGADFLNAIGAASLVPPKYVGIYTVAIAGVVELARRRSLRKECA